MREQTGADKLKHLPSLAGYVIMEAGSCGGNLNQQQQRERAVWQHSICGGEKEGPTWRLLAWAGGRLPWLPLRW